MRISLEASALFAQLRLLRPSLEVERVSQTISAEMANTEPCLLGGGCQETRMREGAGSREEAPGTHPKSCCPLGTQCCERTVFFSRG